MLPCLLGVARVHFLTLTLVCIALAAGMGWYQTQALDFFKLMLVLGLALAAHISVNAFNEYFDFRSGLDFLTERTPFSGGSGTLVAHPQQAALALWAGVISLLVVLLLGWVLVLQQGWALLWIGVPGVLIIYTYTQYINRSPLLCLLAPGVGFGLLMTLGAIWVLAGSVSAGAGIVALIVMLLVSNLLLLNQFPDVEADQQVGRCHYPIAIGRPASAVLLTLLLLMSYGLLILGVAMDWLPPHTLLALLSLLLVWPLMRQLHTYADQPRDLVPALGMNTALCHLYPLLLLIGLVWAA